MSMLAEPRSRQKWSQDPRNTNWSRDKTKFGYQMLTKMGWSEGKGLGQSLSGDVSHIKVNKVGSNAGVGLKKSHDDDWIAHQDDFNALLSSLNHGSSESVPGKMSSLENRVKSSKKKILYKRFIKSKDLSNASSNDLACIFGQRSNSVPIKTQESDNESKPDSNEETSCPINGDNNTPEEITVKTVDSGLSITDYFAKKMAALKNSKKNQEETNLNFDGANAVHHIEECSPIEKKKKKKKCDVPLTSQCTYAENNDKPKKRKKETEDCILENVPVKKKKKKKRTDNLETDTDFESTKHSCEEREVIKKKKKKKKIGHNNEACP